MEQNSPKTPSSKRPDAMETPEEPRPTPSALRPLTGADLERMLEPGWDPTKQWDGTPAILDEGATLILPSRPRPDSAET